MSNSGDNGFEDSINRTLLPLVETFFESTDYAASSRRAVRSDLMKFARWYCDANREPFDPCRTTTRDLTDFRDHLRRHRAQEVSTVNRCLISVRRFYGWLRDQGRIDRSPAEGVKELRRQILAPKTLERAQVRKLLRECDARSDLRAAAIFGFLLYTGCRVSELEALELHDLQLSERSGWATFRFAKGNKQRTVPVPLPARRAIKAYLASRPPVASANVFIGERGPLTTRGVRALCVRYSAIVGVRIHPHLLRHVFGHEFLAANQNDLVALASLLGHENLNTTKRYAARTADQLQGLSDNLTF